MNDQRDTILIVDNDAEVRALLREHVLTSQAFGVLEAKDGPDALLIASQRHPDLILLDIHLPGLSGNDLLVGFKSQGYRGPLIVMGSADGQRGVVEAFRLGATDFVTKPLREAEVLAAVDRGLADVRLRRERDGLVAQLQGANQQLEARLTELTTLYDIGESVTALRDLESVFTHVLDGAITLTGADHALLVLRDDASGSLVLRAGKNLPLAMLDRLGGPVQDPLADLVMTSRETLVVGRDGLRRFKTARDLFAAAYAPLTVQETAIGALAVANHQTNAPLTDTQGRLLSSLANYAAIAIVSARLSYMLGQRTTQVQTAYQELHVRDAERAQQIRELMTRLQKPLDAIEAEIITLAQELPSLPAKELERRLVAASQNVRHITTQVTALTQPKE